MCYAPQILSGTSYLLTLPVESPLPAEPGAPSALTPRWCPGERAAGRAREEPEAECVQLPRPFCGGEGTSPGGGAGRP